MMEELDLRSRYLELDDATESFRESVEHHKKYSRDFDEHFDISWIYHENALEGIVLTYHEIKAAIDQKIISDVNLIPTYQEIKSHKNAIDFVRKAATIKRTKVNLEMLQKIHCIIANEEEGSDVLYRRDIPLHRTYFHDIAHPSKIVDKLDKLLLGANSSEFKSWHPIKQASAFHHEFMAIFPFHEHTGKVGRLMMNFFLLRSGFIPAVIHSIDRQRYYECLRAPALQLRELIIEAQENSIESGLRYLQEMASKKRLAMVQ